MRKLISVILIPFLILILYVVTFSDAQAPDDVVYRENDNEAKMDIKKAANNSNVSEVPLRHVLEVPFTAQAPYGNWDDVRQDYGCEEASLLMASHWISGEELSQEIALREIIAMADFQEKRFGHFHDTSAEDTALIFEEYFGYKNYELKYNIVLEEIKKEIAKNKIILVPADGTILKNKYYTPPGPPIHTLVIIGYDDEVEEFITHDPGTQRGASYRYGYETMMRAIRNNNTGIYEPIDEIVKVMIVIDKEQ